MKRLIPFLLLLVTSTAFAATGLNKMKKLIALLILNVLLISSTAFAATSSVERASKLASSVLEVLTVAGDADLVNNRNIFHSNAVATANGKQFIAYWNNNSTSSGRMVACQRETTSVTWTCYTYDGTGGRITISGSVTAGDDHNSIGLGIDSSGYIHVSLDEHSTSLKYYKSSNPYDVSAFALSTMVGTNETAVSYPIFFKDRNGVLYFTFRDGTVLNGDQYLYKYTGTWAAATGTEAGARAGRFINGKSNSCNPYVGIPQVDSGNIVNFAWSWECTSNQALDVMYVAYDATNGTFKKSDGTSQTIPVTQANQDRAAAVADDGVQNLGALVTKHAVVKDSSGNIYIVYRQDDANAYSQVKVVKHTSGGSWETPISITNDAEPYGVNVTTNYGASRSPVIFIDNSNKMYVLFNSTTPSIGIQVIETSDLFETFYRYTLFYGNTIINRLSNFDYYAWDASNELFLVNHNTGLSQSLAYTRRPLELIHWIPSQGKPKEPVSGFNGIVVHDDLILQSLEGKIFTLGSIFSDDGNYHILSPQDTLASAISKATAGDTILLSNGTWTECITVSKSINIRGISREGSIVNCATADTDTFTVTASNVRFSNMTISNTGGGDVTDLTRCIYFNGASGTVITGGVVDNVTLSNSGGATSKIEFIRFNDASGTLRSIKTSGTQTQAGGTSVALGVTGNSTAEAALTVDVYSSDITIDGRGTVMGVNCTDSSSPSAIGVNFYNSKITATENSTSTTRGISSATGALCTTSLYNTIVSGADVDLNNGASGNVIRVYNATLVNGTTSGTISWAGTQAGNIQTLGSTLTSSGTSSIGWSKQSAANQACNTTCTSACVFGQNTADMTIVDCADATADVCTCAGAS